VGVCLAVITAAYRTLGLVGVWVTVWVARGRAKGSVLQPRFAAEVVTLFLFTLVALLEREVSWVAARNGLEGWWSFVDR
jgi:hypothetical protein